MTRTLHCAGRMRVTRAVALARLLALVGERYGIGDRCRGGGRLRGCDHGHCCLLDGNFEGLARLGQDRLPPRGPVARRDVLVAGVGRCGHEPFLPDQRQQKPAVIGRFPAVR